MTRHSGTQHSTARHTYKIDTYTRTYMHACIALHYITLHYTTLRYATLHYTTLRYTTLHYNTLHYTTRLFLPCAAEIFCIGFLVYHRQAHIDRCRAKMISPWREGFAMSAAETPVSLETIWMISWMFFMWLIKWFVYLRRKKFYLVVKEEKSRKKPAANNIPPQKISLSMPAKCTYLRAVPSAILYER